MKFATFFAITAVVLTAGCSQEQDSRPLENAPLPRLSVETGGPYNGPARSLKSAVIDLAKNDLSSQTNIAKYTGAGLTSAARILPVTELLTRWARSVAYTKAFRSGANCWYTSMAALFKDWEKPRFLSDKEFACHLENSFVETEQPVLGDVIRLQDAKGNEIHGATFVGYDEKSGGVVVFTKNGVHKNLPWTLMFLQDVQKVYPEAESFKFYTPQSTAQDPEVASDPCYREAVKSRIEDADIQAGDAEDPFET